MTRTGERLAEAAQLALTGASYRISELRSEPQRDTVHSPMVFITSTAVHQPLLKQSSSYSKLQTSQHFICKLPDKTNRFSIPTSEESTLPTVSKASSHMVTLLSGTQKFTLSSVPPPCVSLTLCYLSYNTLSVAL